MEELAVSLAGLVDVLKWAAILAVAWLALQLF